jgi:hypothetical protein
MFFNLGNDDQFFLGNDTTSICLLVKEGEKLETLETLELERAGLFERF